MAEILSWEREEIFKAVISDKLSRGDIVGELKRE